MVKIYEVGEVYSDRKTPVPSYDEYKQLVSKTEQLEKKLKIAMETLQKIADYQTDVLLQYWAEGALNKIKEMEGVK